MPRKFWIGLIIILIIYTAYNLFFWETNIANDIPRKITRVIKFAVLVIVYLIGVKHLSLDRITWMKTVWHIIHLTGIFILLTLGIFDLMIRPLAPGIKDVMASINEFLIGPSLFVGMGILHQFLIKIENRNIS
jgi:hypothetical protein